MANPRRQMLLGDRVLSWSIGDILQVGNRGTGEGGK